MFEKNTEIIAYSILYSNQVKSVCVVFFVSSDSFFWTENFTEIATNLYNFFWNSRESNDCICAVKTRGN